MTPAAIINKLADLAERDIRCREGAPCPDCQKERRLIAEARQLATQLAASKREAA